MIKGVTMTVMAAVLAGAGVQAQEPERAAAAGGNAQIVELRQYKIVPGQRDAFVALFERLFVESQEALGMRIVGDYADRDDPDRFVWIRSFPDMAARERGLNAFYFGPVWQAHRDEANPLLDDNDNVLLLRPAAPNLAFAPARPRPAGEAAEGGTVFATIHYLWKRPDEGFAAFFAAEMRPAIEAAGLHALGGYVPEEAPNNFPRLPVREDRKIFVWFTRADDAAALERLRASADWQARIAPRLRQLEERPAQVLRLAPAPRSALR